MLPVLQILRAESAIVFIFVLLVFPATVRAQAGRSHAQARTSGSSVLAEPQALLQERRLPEAKTATQDYLQAHPTSQDAYNLLGIICSSQRDYEGALAAFQHALALNPRSARSHNNLGNLYASAGKPDLEKRNIAKHWPSRLRIATPTTTLACCYWQMDLQALRSDICCDSTLQP